MKQIHTLKERKEGRKKEKVEREERERERERKRERIEHKNLFLTFY